MIKRFDATLEIDDKDNIRNNLFGSDVLDIFNGVSWQEQYKKCLNSHDDFGPFFSVEYKDELKVEYSFDAELYFADENKDNSLPVRFSLTYSYQKIKMKKIFFGLFGEKEELINENIFMDDQTMDFALKCLNAFLAHNHEFLTSNMYENFGADLKELDRP